MISSKSKHLVNFFGLYGMQIDIEFDFEYKRPSRYYLKEGEIRYVLSNYETLSEKGARQLIPHRIGTDKVLAVKSGPLKRFFRYMFTAYPYYRQELT